MNICDKNRHLRQASNRYQPFKERHCKQIK